MSALLYKLKIVNKMTPSPPLPTLTPIPDAKLKMNVVVCESNTDIVTDWQILVVSRGSSLRRQVITITNYNYNLAGKPVEVTQFTTSISVS